MYCMNCNICVCFSRRDRFADEPTACGDRGGPRAAQMRQAGQAALRACAGTVFGHPQTQHPAVQQLRVALRLRIPAPENLNRRVHHTVSFSSAPRNPGLVIVTRFVECFPREL